MNTVPDALPVQPQEATRIVLAMGTRLQLDLPAGAAERALEAVCRVEAFGSTWRPDTPWSRMAAAPGAWVEQGEDALALLATVVDWQRRTEGAFDPLLAPLIQAWGLRSGGRQPSVTERKEALARSGVQHLEVDASHGRARILTAGAGLEEGGFLKGHALDRARAAAGTADGFLDFGGQLLAWGRPVAVAIARPQDRQRPRLALRLSNASLSTSGCSERGRHLLDPRTGEPCPDWGSASVVHPSALVADILSTALYVMGPSQGPAWAERHGVAAAFLTHTGEVRLSSSFQALAPVLLER